MQASASSSRACGRTRLACGKTRQHRVVASTTGSSSSTDGSTRVLVDGLVVDTAHRSSPWEAEARRAQQQQRQGAKAVVMFVSESGVCRAPLAAACFSQLLQGSPLRHWVDVQARATRDYCLGEAPHDAAAAAAAALGIPLPPTPAAGAGATEDAGSGLACACQFDPAADIVAADLVLTMDKFTAADVLREVSSYDLLNPSGRYSSRVRLLGSYSPALAADKRPDAQDIDDALYGNAGGEAERQAVLSCARLITHCCAGLLAHLEAVAAAAGCGEGGAGGQQQSPPTAADDSGAAAFRDALVAHVRADGVISWLVPPMLQGASTDLGGWV